MLADTYNCAVRTVVSKEARRWRCNPRRCGRRAVSIRAGGLPPRYSTHAPQEPIEENVPKYEAFYRMYTKLYPALKDCYKALAAL